MVVEEKRKEIAEIEEKLARNEERLAQLGDTSFVHMSYEEQKKDLIGRSLPGKCPLRFLEGDGEKIEWESVLLKEPYDSCEDVLMDLTGTTDYSISTRIFTSGVYALPGNNIGRNANTAIQSLADTAPHDATEARLCMQEMTLYEQGMRYLNRAENSNMLTQREFYLKSAIKLLRLHNETIEARGKYRRGGEQRVVVQHVQVNDGGKAIVGGNLAMAGGGENKK